MEPAVMCDPHTLAKNAVEGLRQRHPNLSQAQLAEKVGISRPTMTRILSGQYTNLESDTLLKILMFSGDINKVSEEVAITKGWKKIWSERGQALKVDAQKLFLIEKNIPILLAIITGNGVSRDEVKKRWGEQGLSIFNDIAQKKVFLEENDRLRSISDVTWDSNTVFQIMRAAIPLMSTDFPHYVLAEELSDQGVREVESVMKKASRDIMAIMDKHAVKDGQAGKKVTWLSGLAELSNEESSREGVIL